MAKVPVFISFDYDHDATLKEFLVGQAKYDDSPLEIVDQSIKGEAADWKNKARTRIKRSQQVIVICGKHTDTATGVNVEVGIARDEKKRVMAILGAHPPPPSLRVEGCISGIGGIHLTGHGTGAAWRQ